MSEPFKTKAGPRGLVRVGGGSFLCGYVELPDVHPWREAGYDEMPAECHGGLTYKGDRMRDGGIWIGFDAGHSDDMPQCCGTPKDEAYMTSEVERLAEQVAAVTMGVSNPKRTKAKLDGWRIGYDKAPEPHDQGGLHFGMTADGGFDELVVGDWFHIERMDKRSWYFSCGDHRFWVHVPAEGAPKITHYEGALLREKA